MITKGARHSVNSHIEKACQFLRERKMFMRENSSANSSPAEGFDSSPSGVVQP